MKIFKTTVFFLEDNPGVLFKSVTIEHEGKLWLVPSWTETQEPGWRRPERIVCLSNLQYQDTRGSPWGTGDYMLNSPISRGVFHGQLPPKLEDGMIVIENPDIRFPTSP